jgi:predicted lipid-binding transport protein (Tim44 family)
MSVLRREGKMTLRLFSSGRMAKGSRLVAAAAIAALTLVPVMAEARPGGGKSSGSRGSKTYSAPPSTSTAPSAPQPMQRTATPAPAPSMGAPAAGAAAAAAQAARPSFARTMMMGLGAGLLGAGLFGLLSGSGLFGGLSGLASFLGLVLQLALVGGLIYLAVRFFRRRSEPQAAMAGAAPGMGQGMGQGMGAAPQQRIDAMSRDGMSRDGMSRQGLDQPASGFGGFGGQQPAQPVATQPIQLVGEDFGVFEQRLQGLMEAYSRQDNAALARITTPEMAGYLAEDLAEDARNGVMDVSRDVKLVQGDLSEAWREGNDEYATVAMRFSVLNTVVDKASGRIVEGHAEIPREVTEIWTFMRPRGGEWLLSAIQQTV